MVNFTKISNKVIIWSLMVLICIQFILIWSFYVGEIEAHKTIARENEMLKKEQEEYLKANEAFAQREKELMDFMISEGYKFE